MKLLIRLTVLGLAGFGANELYRKLAPRLMGAGSRASTAVDTKLRPAVAEAGKTIQAATEFATHKIADASRETVEAAVDPNAPLGLDDESGQPTAAPSSATATASDTRG